MNNELNAEDKINILSCLKVCLNGLEESDYFLGLDMPEYQELNLLIEKVKEVL